MGNFMWMLIPAVFLIDSVRTFAWPKNAMKPPGAAVALPAACILGRMLRIGLQLGMSLPSVLASSMTPCPSGWLLDCMITKQLVVLGHWY